jgi:hypothetical protein
MIWRVTEFRVRDWLAGYAGCEPDDIEPVGAVRATVRGQEARYEVLRGEMALVVVTWPVEVERSGVRIVLATLGDRDGTTHELHGVEHVIW